MKLNLEDVIVSSFETTFGRTVGLPETDDPTPATRCFDCPGDPEPVTDPGVAIGGR